ncbi:MAG: phosphotransacetylase family protein [Dehalococcoidia bacterium]|nr:MAG: phosphotransacetylase family protein [Dehalococcoidia bacterium]
MVALYLVSSEEAVGKTTIGAGVGKHLLGEGKKVGFLKPIIADKKPVGSENDAVFMKQVLALTEPVDSLCPLISGERNLADGIREAYIEVSQNKDVIIVEGRCGQSSDDNLSKTSYEIAGALKAKVVMVEGYSNGLSAAKFISGYKGFGENLLGVVLNKVPKSRLKRVCDEITSRFSEAELSILGVLPDDRMLFTFTVGELADYIQGEILNNAEKSVELVENIMVGAMSVDSGLDYFGRKANKLVVARDDRPDMQMAALETLTRCLVISGSTGPIDYVRYKAEDRGIPLIITKSDTSTIVQSIEDALEKARFSQEKKLVKLAEILEQHLDFQAIYSGLGLAK